MKLAYLEDADQDRVARAVREVLVDRGARLTEHTPSHTEFRDLPDRDHGYDRAGYVGTYQHVGEREVELRFDVRAHLPHRLFWTTVVVELVVLALLVVLGPSPNFWVTAAALLWLALAATFLLYLSTWRSSRELEADLLEATVGELDEVGDGSLRTELEHEVAELEAELEADRLRRAHRERRKEARRERASQGVQRIREAVGSLVERGLPDEDEPDAPPVDEPPEPEPAPEEVAPPDPGEDADADAPAPPADEVPDEEAELTPEERRRKLERVRALRERIRRLKDEDDGDA